ncbi:MAG: restriction endonuclease subunit S [Chloroflexi bacterium]|nr:restriction endonuclease subunit S [Chloroflexota bacterium]MCI0644214.1 restriction endonuclease subunit S [Chloroflexota bacterium]MCI0730818.1 restriction endonuclease subunit S [Chloroflexota bacterium]
MSWPTVKLGDLVRNVRETSRDPLADGLERYVGLEHIEPENLHVKRWGWVAEGTSFSQVFRQGQVLFGKRRAYQRKVAVAEWDGLCSSDILVFEPKDDRLLPELLPFIVQSDGFFNHALGTSSGSLSPRTKWRDLAQYEFALPPLDEQRRIAEILWAANEAIERYILVQNEIVKASRVAWKDAVDQSEWPKVPLGQVARVNNGSTPSKDIKRYWNNGTIPWLPTEKVHERIIYRADEFITKSALEETSIKLLPSDSVLIAMIGQGKTRGSVAYLSIESCINQNFACAVPNKEIDSWFLFYTLDNSYEKLRTFSQGAVPALNCPILRSIPVRLPPLEQQHTLVALFHRFEKQVQDVQEHIETLSNLKKSLTACLLGNPSKEMESHV